MSTFTAELAASLNGPDWLRRRRSAAAERFAGMAMPTDAEEVWRYSRIGEIDLERYAVADVVRPGSAPSGLDHFERLVGAPGAVVVSVDGRIVRVDTSADARDKGVFVGNVADLHADDVLGCAAGDPTEPFTALNDAFSADPIVVRIPDGVVLDEPVLVFSVLTQPDTATFPRLVVQVGRDAQATVLEHHSSGDDIRALSVPVTELDIAQAGRLEHLNVQQLGTQTHQIGHQASRVERDAHLSTVSVALGGDYARLRSDSRLVGQGASSELLAVYFGERTQMHDFRTLQAHEAPHTNSELLFKGAVEDTARGVYSGLIRIEKQAQKSNAFQTNRNLVLSEGAHADSVPNLEIEANDVRCSHATAVGPIDDDQRYYVESRGLPPEVAERLIVLGFFGEVLARMPITALEADLRRAVSDKLQRRTA